MSHQPIERAKRKREEEDHPVAAAEEIEDHPAATAEEIEEPPLLMSDEDQEEEQVSPIDEDPYEDEEINFDLPADFKPDSKLTKELRDAVWAEDLPKVQALLAQKADINGYSQNKYMSVMGSRLIPDDHDDDGVVFGTALHAACQIDDIAMVHELLKAKADVAKTLLVRITAEVWQNSGSTALHYVAHNGSLSLAEKLLEAKADINARRKPWATPLIMALWAKNNLVLQLLLDKKANIHLKAKENHDSNFMTAWETVSDGVREFVEFSALNAWQRLIAAKASQCPYPTTYGPLAGAIVDGAPLSIINALCQAKADPNRSSDEYSPLLTALEKEGSHKIRTVEMLLKAKARLPSLGINYRQLIADEKNVPIKRLLERRLVKEGDASFDPDSIPGSAPKAIGCTRLPLDGKLTTKLHWAIWEEDYSQVESLLDQGADIAQYSQLNPALQEKLSGSEQHTFLGNALHAAANVSDGRILDSLLFRAAGQAPATLRAPVLSIDLTMNVCNPLPDASVLYCATVMCNVTFIDSLMRVDDVESMNAETALIWAAREGQDHVVELLLSHEVQPNKTGKAETALMAAVDKGHFFIASKLLKARADVNQLVGGLSPLQKAVTNGEYDMVSLLCDAKANPNLGRPSPLASAGHRPQIIKLLLVAKARLFECNEGVSIASELIKRLKKHDITPQILACIRLLDRQKRQVTVLAGLHRRAGASSFLYQIANRSSLFDRQVMRLPLRLSGATVTPRIVEKLEAESGASPTTEM